MDPSVSTFFAVLLPCLACLGVYIVYTSRPDLFLAEPRRTIERLSRTIYLSSPSDADLAKAFRLVEFVASSGQDVSRAASDARALLKRRIALVDGWIDRLGRFAGKDVDPAPLGYMRDLPTGTTPHDIVGRAQAWASAGPIPHEAAQALESARIAIKAGFDSTSALVEARAKLARHALSLESALDELEMIG